MIIFITTKNLDYLRNVQEIELLKQKAEVRVIGSYAKSYVKRLFKVYFQLLTVSMKNADEIFVGFAPQLVVPFWNWKLKKKKVTIDFFISLYDTLVFDRKKFKEGSLPARVVKWMDQRTIRHADHIIADTKAHGRYFTEEFHADPEKLEVLYLTADKSIYYPREQKKPAAYEDKFVVLYFGSVLPLQGVEIVLEAMELLKDRKDIQFEMIGPIGKQYQKPQADNITYIPWLCQEELAEHIAYSDLCLAGHFNDEIMKAKRTIPGKAYIYRAMGKPMILGDNAATREIFTEGEDGVYFVKMGDAGAVVERLSNPGRLRGRLDAER